MSIRKLSPTLWILLVSWLMVVNVAKAKPVAPDEMIVIVRAHIGSSHNYTYFNEGFSKGGGLYKYGADGFQQLVDAAEGQILDCSLSYDAQKVMFSWKKDERTNYDLYTINVDGSDLQQLTSHPSNNFNATWLPDGGIAFLSDRDSNYAYCMHSSSAVLYRMEADGSQVTRLSANYLSDIAPSVMHDGKIVYCRWEYVDRTQIPCQGLWAQNPDGTGLKHIFAGRLIDPITVSEARSIPGTNKLVATLTGHNGPICGAIGVVDLNAGANNPDAVKTILGDMVVLRGQGRRTDRQKYEFPYPIDENHFLVSNAGSIEMSDFDGKNVSVILPRGMGPSDERLGFHAAIPVQPREREPVIKKSISANDKDKNATVIMQDVYIGLEQELEKKLIKRGDIKELRVIELLAKDNKGLQRKRAFCWQFPVVSGGATMEPKRTLSRVKVEDDGSAMFEVPPMTPLFFQALDADGKVIQRMRTFTQLMPGEVQSCTGCHMDRNNSLPVNKNVSLSAYKKVAQKPNGAEWDESLGGFSYSALVQPIWDAHCIECHHAKDKKGGLDLTGDKTDLFSVSYDNLVRTDVNKDPTVTNARPEAFEHRHISYIPSYNGVEHKYLSEESFKPFSWGAYKSPLVDLIKSGHKDADGKPRVNLSELEKRIVYAWIDYNVPYYHSSHTNHPQLDRGMRDVTPRHFDRLLSKVEESRCMECHTEKKHTAGWWSWGGGRDRKGRLTPRDHYLNWENPEMNNFMLAPLAKSAGGTEACGKAVFKDKNDPDYQKLIRAFDETYELMKNRPRIDIEGAKEVRTEEHTKLYKNILQP
ncbi:PD40 domain-containing protein [Persicirhabdus sediminis]|uniref:PD40 domain-containing protein n=1 Tax=Persicirhabdus sediminis TaxID=454144 RepID=A0A8J7MBT9_9BACT|nr:PD40 domain-containing protein [Persicirhabdus sediminis]MBK1789560.1 PD40 domain-containing protein [Persicirhabdus sediminis]